MRKLTRALALLCLAAAGCAPINAQLVRDYWASDYGQWSIPSQGANSYTFTGNVCTAPQPGSPAPFNVFNTNAPIFIVDSTPANSELVTPSALVGNGSTSCGVTVSPVNPHYSFKMVSGTAGLQEVLNQIASTNAYPASVIIDRNWYTGMSGITGSTPAGAINSVVGNAQAYLIDKTTVPWTYYSWNGTNYTPSASNVTAPTVAPGAGAGTSPTIAVAAGSTGLAGYVTLTTGTTPTAAAAVFTLTWPPIASGGFQYAPSCTYVSMGTRAYAGTLTASATAGPPATGTATDSTGLTASVSGYKFKYNCH